MASAGRGVPAVQVVLVDWAALAVQGGPVVPAGPGAPAGRLVAQADWIPADLARRE